MDKLTIGVAWLGLAFIYLIHSGTVVDFWGCLIIANVILWS